MKFRRGTLAEVRTRVAATRAHVSNHLVYTLFTRSFNLSIVPCPAVCELAAFFPPGSFDYIVSIGNNGLSSDTQLFDRLYLKKGETCTCFIFYLDVDNLLRFEIFLFEKEGDNTFIEFVAVRI